MINNFYSALSLIINYKKVPSCFSFNDKQFDICLNYVNDDGTDISDDVVILNDILGDFIYYVDYSTSSKLYFVKFKF